MLKELPDGPFQPTWDSLSSYQVPDWYVAANSASSSTGASTRAALADHEINQRAFDRADGEGGTVRLAVWNQPGDTLYGMFARCERTVNSMENILGGEVYHYHSKMILKEPKVGGAWAWH